MIHRRIDLSVVIPFFNEEESIECVCEEVKQVLQESTGLAWELIMVDDGSTDRTPDIVDDLARRYENFHAIHLRPNSGQSAALNAGFEAAWGDCVATLDGDGQNDPADIPHLLAEMEKRGVHMMCGIRKKRADKVIRRISSRVANRTRSFVLKDGITDIGCSMRVFRRDCLQKIRMFRNAHRFFPALFKTAGFSVAEMPVNHRERQSGTSKYGGGINSRLWAGLADLAGVYWITKRSFHYQVMEKAGRGLHG